jgi:uncharacterized protein YndB with AHSA1/START domain
MTTESIQVEETYPVPPAKIYEVWLDADAHGRFTGAPAMIDPVVGGKHTAHDDYIWGTFLELEPQRRIVQAWRTTEFPAEAHDSRVEVLLEAIEGGTRVTILHSNIPEGQGERYRHGWRDFYLDPLKSFLMLKSTQGMGATAPVAAPAAAPALAKTKAAAKKPAAKKVAAKKVAAKKTKAAKAAKKKAAPAKKAGAKKAAAKKVAAKKTKAAPAKKRGAKKKAKQKK